MNETDERIEDEEVEEAEETLDEMEPSEADIEAAGDLPPDPATGDAESIQEMLTKQEAADEDDREDDDEAIVTTIVKDDHVEPTLDTSRVLPMQESEFQCRKCFLVKNRSQLADKKKLLCRDCA